MKRTLVALLSAALLGVAPVSMASGATAAQASASAPEKTPDAAWSTTPRSARATNVTTKVVLELSAPKALHNTQLTLTGIVGGLHPTDQVWYPVTNGTVTLHRRWQGEKAWQAQGTKQVTGDEFNYTFRAQRNAAYRVTYNGGSAGDYVFARSEASTTLGVARRFNESITKRTLIFRGRIVPSFARKAVVIQRRTCATCAWKPFAKVRTDRGSRWSKKLTAPGSLGQKWYFRVVTPASSQYLKSYSRTAETFRRH